MAILFTLMFAALAVVGYKFSWHIGLTILFSGFSLVCLVVCLSRRRKLSSQVLWAADTLEDLLPDHGDIDADWD